MKTYYLFIDGNDVSSSKIGYSIKADEYILRPLETMKLYSAIKKGTADPNKSSSKMIGKFYLADEHHIDAAINSSFEAFSTFKKLKPEKRAQILLEVNKSLKKNKAQFINLLIAEGHPYKLALWQFENMINGTTRENVQFYLSMVKQSFKKGKEKIVLIKKPDGVVLVMPPRNAPASNSFVALSALITGNTLLIKPPQQLPVSTIFLWKDIVSKVLDDLQIPQGVINIIQGNSSQILDKCLDSPKIKTVFAFGESDKCIEMGKKIYEHSKKPILELSGNDLFIVWKDAFFSKQLIHSALEVFLGSTQICMVPKLFIIHHEIYDKFVNTILKEIKNVKAGLPQNKKTWLSPIGKRQEYVQFIKDAELNGAKKIAGGYFIDHNNKENPNGIFAKPTVLLIESIDSFMETLCFKKEIFFPIMPIVRAGSSVVNNKQILDKLIDLSNQNNYGLRISAWTNDETVKDRLVQEVNNCGSIRINSRHIGYSSFLSTHGGTGLTGGPFGELNYMCLRAGHLQGISSY